MNFLVGTLIGAAAVWWWYEHRVIEREEEEAFPVFGIPRGDTTGTNSCEVRWHLDHEVMN